MGYDNRYVFLIQGVMKKITKKKSGPAYGKIHFISTKLKL
jgi:hypothetical protein